MKGIYKIIGVLILITTRIHCQGQSLFGRFTGGKSTIKGESMISGHTNDIDLINYQIEIQKNGRGLENKICLFTKYADAASTSIVETMENNEIKTFIIENYKSLKQGEKTLNLILTFEKAQIIRMRQWYDEAKQKTFEEVEIGYNKLKMSYIPKKQEVEITLGTNN